MKSQPIFVLNNAVVFLKRLFRPNDLINGASLLPIRLTMLYLSLSVAVYIWGPIDWTTANTALFYFLLVMYMVALWLGYRIGIKKIFSRSFEWERNYTEKYLSIFSVLIIANYLIYVVNIFRDYGMQTFDFPDLIRQMAIGIKNPGLGYHYRNLRVETLQGSQVLGGRVVSVLNYIWSFFRYPILLTGMLCFKKLRIWGKLFMVLYLITTVLFYLSIGTTIDILNIFLLLELPIILSTFSAWHKKKLTGKHIVKLAATFFVGVLLILSYFTWMMVSRGGINNYDQPDYNIGGVHLSSESTAFQVPPVLMKFWISFSSYFTQGYYGMAQAIDLPWTPMFGVGNSMFLVDFISEHIYDIDQYTYQMKTELVCGWNSDVRWNCIYTWLANDFSFYGVPIAMLMIGILFGAMFQDAIINENPFAKMSVFYFMLMILFIPCNNQIAQRPDTLFSFLFVVFCWVLSKYPPKVLLEFFQKIKGENNA